MMGDIVPFAKPHRGGKGYRVEFVLFEGRKRRQWAVIEREPDGTESYLQVSRGRLKEALYMAALWAKVEAERQSHREMLAADPLGQFILAMPPEQRDFLHKLLEAEKRLRG